MKSRDGRLAGTMCDWDVIEGQKSRRCVERQVYDLVKDRSRRQAMAQFYDLLKDKLLREDGQK